MTDQVPAPPHYGDGQTPDHWFPTAHSARTRGVVPEERTIELPLTFTRPPVFGDGESEAAYLRARERAIETQRFRFAVAPLCSVTSRRGLLQPGAEVTVADDCAGSHEVMALLVKRGIVLELSTEVAAERGVTPEGRYRVGADALVVRGRVIPPGHDISAADLAVPARPGTPEQAPHVAMDGTAVPGRPAVPARAGTDGEEQLRHLVAKGRVIDTQAETATQAQQTQTKGKR